MRNLKRVLSMALASVMVLGLTVVGASAANFNDQAEIKHTTAAAVMSAIGVLEGNEKGDFMPDQVLTREQAAKIICYMLMGPENAEKLGVSDKEIVKVACGKEGRKLIFDDVVIRVRSDFATAMHIDTDESNACLGATEGEIVR